MPGEEIPKTPEVFNIKAVLAQHKEVKEMPAIIRDELVVPKLDNGEEVVLDFTDVAFIDPTFETAVIRDMIEKYGLHVLDKLKFDNTNPELRDQIA